ncbi:MAG: hypothetical protein Q9169_008579, partial [Polycauliona sp. 2 TL-2023]
IERTANWSINSVEYFRFLLAHAIHSNSLLPMLRGFITTASLGSELLVRNSRIALLQILASSSPTQILLIHETLVQIILSAIPSTQSTSAKPVSGEVSSQTRLLRPALDVLAFVLDNDTELQIRDSTCYHSLLSPLRAVHATTDLPTLQALVGIHAGCMTHTQLRTEVMKILHHLLLHRYPSIRLAAAGALGMTLNSEELRRLDLAAEKGELREEVQRLLKANSQVASEAAR